MSQASFKHLHKHPRAFRAVIALCLFSALLPMRAYAVFVPTNDFQLNYQKALDLGKVFGLDGLARLAAQTALSQIESSMVNWIKGGGPGGGPMYITDLSGFLYDIGTTGAHQQAAYLRSSNTCYTTGGGTNSTWIDPDTGLPYRSTGGVDDIVAASIDNAILRGQQQSVACPFGSGQPFRSVAQDGWGGFLNATTNPGANAFAGDIAAQEKIAGINQREHEIALAKFGANRGYLDATDCSSGTCVVTTPGAVIETQTSFALGSGIRSWENVSKINELVGAVMNAAIERVFTEAGALFDKQITNALPGAAQNVVQSQIQNNLTNLQRGVAGSLSGANTTP